MKNHMQSQMYYKETLFHPGEQEAHQGAPDGLLYR
jgi:hypothetical protein